MTCFTFELSRLIWADPHCYPGEPQPWIAAFAVDLVAADRMISTTAAVAAVAIDPAAKTSEPHTRSPYRRRWLLTNHSSVRC